MNTPTSRSSNKAPNTRNHLLALAVASCFSAGAWALPVAPTVVGGSASFSQNGNVLNVKNSNGAIINWQSFSIGAGETTRFLQSSASSSVLNRVLAGDPSLIYGTLSSNGRVWLVNPAGILVGAGGRIDTAGFVASTLAVKNSDFLANKLTFGSGDGVPTGTVVNQGTITTPQGGSVYLIGAGVENNGLVQTPRGETVLAAGKTVQLIDTGTPGVKVEVTGDGQSTNLGQIVADAGRIGLVGSLVKNSGTLNASSVVKDGGRVFLKASQDAYVDGDGRIVTTGVKGGRVEVLGDRVALAGNAAIDASGATGGGTVLVGGDYQGKNTAIQNAEVTYFGGNASVKADAIDSGNGGKVIFWADNTTRAYGNISAKGGANSGNGGFVETSGKKFLDINGIRVSASAAKGNAGNWLLDPTDISIVHDSTGNSLDSGISGNPNFLSSPNDSTAPSSSTISDFTLNAAINSGTSVTLSTSSGASAQGDVTFDGSSNGAILIDKTSAGTTTFTVNASRDISFKGSSTIQTSSGSGALSVVMNTGSGRQISMDSTSGAVDVSLTGNGGGLTLLVNGAGNKWENTGTVSVNGNAQLHLYDNGSGGVARFDNLAGATLNLASSTGWSVFSNSGSQAGVISNDGIINSTGMSGGTYDAWEAKLDQSATGTLNVTAGHQLSIQNAGQISGIVNLGAAGGATLSEQHGGSRTFLGASINGPGTLSLAVPTTFNGSSIYGATVAIGSAGSFTLTGTPTYLSNLALTADASYTLPTNATYDNSIAVLSKANLTVPDGIDLTPTGTLTLVAGWDGTSATGSPSVSGGVGTLTVGPTTLGISANSIRLLAGNSMTVASNLIAPSTINAMVAGDNGLMDLSAGTLDAHQISLSADRMNLNATKGAITINECDCAGPALLAITPWSDGRGVVIGGSNVNALTGSGGKLGLSAAGLAAVKGTGGFLGGPVGMIAIDDGAVPGGIQLTGPVTLDTSIYGLSIVAGAGFTQAVGANLSVPSGGLTLSNTAGDITLRAGLSAANFVNIDLQVDNGLLDGTGASISVTNGKGTLGSGAVDIHADRMNLPAISVVDGAWVHLDPYSGRTVSLGGADVNQLSGSGGKLGLSAAELAGITATSTATYGGAILQISPIVGNSLISIDGPVVLDPTVNKLLLYTFGNINQATGNPLTVKHLSVFAPSGDALLSAANNIQEFDLYNGAAVGGALQLNAASTTLNIFGDIVATNANAATNSVQITNTGTLAFQGGNVYAGGGGKLVLQASHIDLNAGAGQAALFVADSDINLTTPLATGVIDHSGANGADLFSYGGAVNLIGHTINTGGTTSSALDVNIAFDGDLTINNTISSATVVNIHVYGGAGSLSGGLPGTVAGIGGTGNLIHGRAAGVGIDILAPKTSLWAEVDIGTSNNPITTQTGSLTVRSDTGDVWVKNTGSLSLVGDNLANSHTIAIDASGGISYLGNSNNSLIADTLLLKSGGNIDFNIAAADLVGNLSAYSNGGVRFISSNVATMTLVKDAWTGGAMAVYAGGGFTPEAAGKPPKGVDIQTVGGLVVEGSVRGEAGYKVGLIAPSIQLGSGKASADVIGGSADILELSTDSLTFFDVAGISAAKGVAFGTYTAHQDIGIVNGGAAACSPNCLVLDLSDLKPILSTPLLAFGRDVGGVTPSGDLHLYTDLTGTTLPGSVTSLGLLSGGAINQNGKSITVANLAVSAGSSVNLNTSVDTFAGEALGGLTLNNSKALTLGTVGITNFDETFFTGVAANGPISITSAGTLTNAGGIASGPGSISLTASSGNIVSNAAIASNGGAISLTATSGNVVNGAPGITSGGGDVTVSAGGSISTALINAGSGKVKLTASGGGVADLDSSAPNIFASLLLLDVNGASDFGGQVGKLAGTTHGNNLTFAQTGNLLLDTLDLGSTGDLDLKVSGTLTSGLSGTNAGNANIIGRNIKLAANSINLATQVDALDMGASGNIVIRETDAVTAKATVSAGDFTLYGGALTMGVSSVIGGKMTLNASGVITQTGALSADTLTTQSNGGATLDFANHIFKFNATDTGSGDIKLINSNPLTVGTVATAGAGSVTINNTGAVTVNGPVSVDTGAIDIEAHSPLTIGSGGIHGGGNITLIAHPSANNNNNLTIGGVVSTTSTTGTVLLSAGNNITQNANITTGGAGVSLAATSGSITMATGTTTNSNGGTIGVTASGNIVLSKLNAGSGTVNLDAGGGISSAPGTTGSNVIAKTATISATTAKLSTSVKTLEADVSGNFTITDTNTGTVITDTPPPTTTDTGTTGVVQTGTNEVTKNITTSTNDNKTTSTPVEDIKWDSVLPSTSTTTAYIPVGHTLGGGNGEFGENDPSQNKKDKDKDKDSNTNNPNDNKPNDNKPNSNLPKC